MIKFIKDKHISNELYVLKEYKKGEIIFQEGEECKRVGLVLNGEVRIFIHGYNDNEYEINLISTNELLGAFLIFVPNSLFLGTGVATKNTTICFFSKAQLLKAFQNQSFLELYLNKTSKQTLTIQSKVKVLSMKNIKDKVLFLLYNNYYVNGVKIYKIKSKNELSNFINCPRPSLSRVLIELKNDNIINYNRYYIELI